MCEIEKVILAAPRYGELTSTHQKCVRRGKEHQRSSTPPKKALWSACWNACSVGGSDEEGVHRALEPHIPLPHIQTHALLAFADDDHFSVTCEVEESEEEIEETEESEEAEKTYMIDKILDSKRVGRSIFYLVQWEGYDVPLPTRGNQPVLLHQEVQPCTQGVPQGQGELSVYHPLAVCMLLFVIATVRQMWCFRCCVSDVFVSFSCLGACSIHFSTLICPSTTQ